MKVGPVTKLDKVNTTTSKNFDDHIMWVSFDVIFFFPIYIKFAAMLDPVFGCMVYKTYIFINSNLSFYKNWKQN